MGLSPSVCLHRSLSFSLSHCDGVNFSLNTDDPLVSVCAQKSLLLWFPCGLLWLLAPLQGYRLMRSKARHIPHSLINVVKTVLAIGLLILAIADLISFSR